MAYARLLDSLAETRGLIKKYRILSDEYPVGDLVAKSAEALLSMKPHFLTKAFEHFGLDPNKQLHRDLLLIVLAHAVFVKRSKGRKKGSTGKKKWDMNRQIELLEDVAKAHESFMGKGVTQVPSVEDIARKTKRLFAERYKDTTVEQLRQQLSTITSKTKGEDDFLSGNHEEMVRLARAMRQPGRDFAELLGL
jgi:hypothetical protein